MKDPYDVWHATYQNNKQAYLENKQEGPVKPVQMKVFQNTLYKTEKDWTQWNDQFKFQEKSKWKTSIPYKPISLAYPICLSSNLKHQLRRDSSISFKARQQHYSGLSTDAKFSEKLAFLNPGVRCASFSENFAYLLHVDLQRLGITIGKGKVRTN